MKQLKTFLLFYLIGACAVLPTATFAAFGLTTTTDYYQVDTGAGLVFKVRRVEESGVNPNTVSIGDIRSMVYNGVEYQDQSRGSQVTSGFDYLYSSTSAVTVSAQTISNEYVKITVQAGNLTHYYMARNGDPHIYMATYFTTEPDIHGLVRYIVRIPHYKLPNGSEPAEIGDTDMTVESGDIFGYSPSNSIVSLRGQTRSKHYSNMRLNDWSYFGATGSGVGAWMVRDNNEGGSGGPFYRCLIQQGSGDQELTYIVNYGEVQTEAFRTHILNYYTLVFNDGSEPAPLDTSWFGGMGLLGYVPSSGRGSVSGSGISGRDTTYTYTVGLANANAQFWAEASSIDGSFSVTNVLPGTYDLTVYKNELEVYTDTVTLSAGNDTVMDPITIADDPSEKVPVWRIGDWDGTPTELLNGDKITTMHPSDVRMANWNTGTYVVGSSSPATDMPCYQWKDIAGGSKTIQFTLTADQIVDSVLRIGITVAYSGGRPDFDINGWNDGVYTAISSQPSTRSLTVGSYRGNNTMYTFNIPASALQVGVNTLHIYPISGSGLSGYLSAGYSLDCIDFYDPNGQPASMLPEALYTFEGNAADSTGNGNNGTATAVSYAADGVNGQSAHFNGSSSYVGIPRCIQDNFTVSCWVKTTATGGTGTQWWQGKGLIDGEVAGSYPDWGMALLNGKVALGIGSPDTTFFSASTINDGVWHHVAATRDNASGTVKIYVDGALETTGTGATGSRSYPPALRIGSLQSGSGFFNGAIDQVRLYARVLSVDEIADSDDDGLEDVWEMANFGNLDQIGTDDPDGDGDDNETEETNGTPPTISSIPPNMDLLITNGMLNLVWPSNNTGWRLMYNTNLMTNTWIEVSGSAATNAFETPFSGLPAENIFYKLVYP